MRYEDLIEEVGSNGKFQKRLYILLFLATIPNGLNLMLPVFTHYTPKHHCNMMSTFNYSMTANESEVLKQIIIPIKDGELDNCEIYNLSQSVLMEIFKEIQNDENVSFVANNETGKIKCPSGYYYQRDYENLETAVTEFNMVCEKKWIKPLMTSLYMVGLGVGSLSGWLSDNYGRKIIFLIFTYMNFIAIGLNAMAWNIISYGFFMFMGGVCHLVNFVVAFVLACELMNVEDRSFMAVGPFLAFSTGYTILALWGYMILNWRWLLAANALIGFLFIPYIWLIPESPRWLLTKGREEDACKLLQQMAKMNGKNIDVKELLKSGISLESEKEETLNDIQDKNSLSDFFRSSTIRKRFCVICYAWFVTSLVYYTIALNTAALAGDRFVNCMLIAVAEIPAYIIGYLIVKYLGRPSSLAVLMIFSGLCCAIAPFLTIFPATANAAVAMMGKFAITPVFFVVYFYFAELVPTLHRNFSVGMGSFSARVSGFLAPYLIYAGESLNEHLPYLLMGTLAFLCAILTVIYLPETRGVPMPDTIQDAVDNKRYLRFSCTRKRNPTKEVTTECLKNSKKI